jgi:hypothetical protein
MKLVKIETSVYREALEVLLANGKAFGTAAIEWARVGYIAMAYCQKGEQGFDRKGDYDMIKAVTYNLIDERETIPPMRTGRQSCLALVLRCFRLRYPHSILTNLLLAL